MRRMIFVVGLVFRGKLDVNRAEQHENGRLQKTDEEFKEIKGE
jgi:hypothetical protein